MSRTEQWTEVRIVWEHTGDSEFPYRAEVEGQTLTIRVNDFPAEPLYTLFVGDTEVEDLEDWPELWDRPPVPQHLLDMLEETRKRKRQSAP
jgi:hypothetical protein